MFNHELDKQRLLDLTQADYEFVKRTLDALTLEQMLIPNVEGHWSTKDTIAHLTAWMKRLLTWVDRAGRGEDPVIPEAGYTWDDINTFNDLQYERDRDLPLKVVLDDFHSTYQRVYAMIAGLTEEQLFKSDWGGLFRQAPYPLVNHNTYLHFHEHITAVRRYFGK